MILIPLYNPLLENLEIDVDKLGSNPEHFTFKMGDIALFPDYAVPIIEDALIEKLLNKNPPKNHNRKKQREELLKIIRVTQNGLPKAF